MKLDLASLFAVATTIAKHIESGKQAVAVIREIVKKDYPDDLAAFDAQVASTTGVWEGAKAAAAPSTAGGE